MNIVAVYGTGSRFQPLKRPLRHFLGQCLRRLNQRRARLEVILVDNSEIRALNKTYRRKDKVTNVLSFPVDRTFRSVAVKSGMPLPLGEIYLAPGYIKAHKESIRFMAAHGLLHLLGYDHEQMSAAAVMQRLERKLMA
jgi:probable rRNA maturation factor